MEFLHENEQMKYALNIFFSFQFNESFWAEQRGLNVVDRPMGERTVTKLK